MEDKVDYQSAKKFIDKAIERLKNSEECCIKSISKYPELKEFQEEMKKPPNGRY